MDFFRGWTSIVKESDESVQAPADTVERIIGRISTSTHGVDRRDACRALKALSRKYRVEVGAQGMLVLIDVLQDESCDVETIGYALDTLFNITTTEPFDDDSGSEGEGDHNDSVSVGDQFAEIFVKSAENVKLVIQRLEEYNFKVRWPAVKLLTVLVKSRTKDIQDIILSSPLASSKLMDLLSDSREIIRNDALILLIHLVKGNMNIQKIIAFENGFERLFEVIHQEGLLHGGVVVEDALTLILSLLKNNASNQQFFKESSYIQRLTPFALLGEIGENAWTPQLIVNTHLILQIIRSLVSTGNIQVNISSCQSAIRNCRLLEALCSILMENGIPVRILFETINTVAEVIRGDQKNQEYMYSLMAPCTPPQSALLILLMSMINEKQVFELRCAILYCFQSYLHLNKEVQEKIVQTLIPSGENISSLTVGQLLCGGLISTEPLTSWLSANAIMHVLIEEQLPKEQLLRVLLAKTDNNLSTSLLEKCGELLQTRQETQTRIGIAMLLCTWVSGSKKSVKAFLSITGITEYLLSHIIGNEQDENEVLYQGLCAFLLGNCLEYSDLLLAHSSRHQLFQSIEKHVGLEAFILKIGEISQHSSYSIASKTPCIQVATPNKLLLDYSFCKLFKTTEGTIINTLYKLGSKGQPQNISENDTEIIGQYKSIIREQDHKLQSLNDALKERDEKNKQLHDEIILLKQKNSKLVDQNTLYKAQLSAAKVPQIETKQSNSNHVSETNADCHQNQVPNENQYEVKSVANKSAEAGNDQDDLIELLLHQESLIARYRERLQALGQNIDDPQQ